MTKLQKFGNSEKILKILNIYACITMIATLPTGHFVAHRLNVLTVDKDCDRGMETVGPACQRLNEHPAAARPFSGTPHGNIDP